jgi:hypothetical protein
VALIAVVTALKPVRTILKQLVAVAVRAKLALTRPLALEEKVETA